jgi:hypothetical protein
MRSAHVVLSDFIDTHPGLLDAAQRVRFLLMRGVWRRAAIGYYRRRHTHATAAYPSGSALFPDLDAAATAAAIERDGFSPAPTIPEHIVEAVRRHHAESGEDFEYLPHLRCEALAEIAYDPSILAVAREYLGVEPVLFASRVYDTPPRPVTAATRNVHFDATDFLDVTLFFYLTDVDEEASPHVVYPGTHRYKSWHDLRVRRYTAAQAEERFGRDCPRTITGKAGTAFFEDTAVFHRIDYRQQAGRLMASVTYTIHRPAKLARSTPHLWGRTLTL